MPTMEVPYLEYYRKGIKCLVGQEKNMGPEAIQKVPQKPLFRATHIVKYTNYEKVVGRHYTKITSEEYLKALK